MASTPQHSCISALNCGRNGNTIASKRKPNPNFFMPAKFSCFTLKSLKTNAESSQPSSFNPSGSPTEAEFPGKDPVKAAFARAKAYKKSILSSPESTSSPMNNKAAVEETKILPGLKGGTEGIFSCRYTESSQSSSPNPSESPPKAEPEDKDPMKAAFARAKAYKKAIVSDPKSEIGLKGRTEGISRDWYIGNKEEATVSKNDFMGLNFSDEKKREGLAAGLVPLNDPFPQGDQLEVEFIAGDKNRFETLMPLVPDPVQEDNSDLYKPKVTTWGVFPRPGNISKTFGGGRVIRPGEVLETAEVKAVKEARTRKLISAYRDRAGLNLDPRLRSEGEKALNDGNFLMDLGKLKDALSCYEKVMGKLAFKSELHGLAALQWSICQDSLNRPNEARAMYDRLQSHPYIEVRKKAKQFIFGFKAMEIMKVKSSTASVSVYKSYFEAFVDDKVKYPITEAESDQGALTQALPYILFLISPPIFIFVLLAVKMGA